MEEGCSNLPFPFCSDWCGYRLADGTPPDPAFYFEADMHNYGTVPLGVSRIVVSRRLVDRGTDPMQIDWQHNIPESEWQIPVAPGAAWKATGIDLTLGEATLVHTDQKDFYFRVRIDYRNVFSPEERYHTQYTFRVLVVADPANLHANVANLKDYILFQSVPGLCSIS